MLDQFYHTIFRDLQQVNMKNSTELCDEIIGALGEVRASWAELADNERRTGSPEGAASTEVPGEEADRPQRSSVTLSI
jgi:flagellin-specific chaperone FliS